MANFKLLVKNTDPSSHFPIAVQRLFDGWLQAIERRIRTHLINIGDEADGAEVIVTVGAFRMITERILTREICQRTLAVHVTGQFAGNTIDFKVEKTRSLDLTEFAPKSRMASDMTLIGNPILESFIRKIAKEPDGDLTMSAEQIDDEPLFAEFNLNLIEEFDKQTGRDQDLTVVSWRYVQWFTRVVTAIVLIAATAWCYHDAQLNDAKINRQTPAINRLIASLIGGVLAAAPAWLLLFSATAGFMPIEFFKRHASGQRAMKFIGCTDPAKARWTLRFAPLVLVAIGGFIWYTFVSTFGPAKQQ